MNKDAIAIPIRGLHGLPEAVQRFIQEVLPLGRVFAIDAPMGTGKTTFIKALCWALGVEDIINSPTFSIINEYYSGQLDRYIYHIDAYRLEHPEDAFNLGFEDYVQGDALMFIEWPEVLEPLLPRGVVYVALTEELDGSRLLTVQKTSA